MVLAKANHTCHVLTLSMSRRSHLCVVPSHYVLLPSSPDFSPKHPHTFILSLINPLPLSFSHRVVAQPATTSNCQACTCYLSLFVCVCMPCFILLNLTIILDIRPPGLPNVLTLQVINTHSHLPIESPLQPQRCGLIREWNFCVNRATLSKMKDVSQAHK